MSTVTESRNKDSAQKINCLLLRQDVKWQVSQRARRVIGGVEVLLRFRLQSILLGLKEVLNDGVNQLVQFLLQLCQVTVEEVVNLELWGKISSLALRSGP